MKYTVFQYPEKPYTQIHLYIIFAVQYRLSLISPSWKNELYKYITGIVQHYQYKMIIINSMPDHVQMLIGMRPVKSLSCMMEKVKGDSSG